VDQEQIEGEAIRLMKCLDVSTPVSPLAVAQDDSGPGGLLSIWHLTNLGSRQYVAQRERIYRNSWA